MTNDRVQLPVGGSDGFQKSVEPYVFQDGYLKDIVDDQITRKHEQQQGR